MADSTVTEVTTVTTTVTRRVEETGDDRGVLSDIAHAGVHAVTHVVQTHESSSGGVLATLGLDDVVKGLKELLTSAVLRAVKQVGAVDGFLANDAIKILIPQQLTPVQAALKGIGQAGLLTQFEASLNRAAERAAPKATSIFVDAICALKLADVKGIWESETHTGASEFLEKQCSRSMREAFTPEVDAVMQEHPATMHFDMIVKVASHLPFVSGMLEGFNLNEYTITKTLEGLFHVCKAKEREVRTNPSMRPSELAHSLFKHLDDPSVASRSLIECEGDVFTVRVLPMEEAVTTETTTVVEEQTGDTVKKENIRSERTFVKAYEKEEENGEKSDEEDGKNKNKSTERDGSDSEDESEGEKEDKKKKKKDKKKDKKKNKDNESDFEATDSGSEDEKNKKRKSKKKAYSASGSESESGEEREKVYGSHRPSKYEKE